jgi:hypothetical protein
MARSGLMATTSSFAHLLGLGAPAAAKPAAEESDEDRRKREDEEARRSKKAEKPDDQGEDESDEDYKKRKEKEQEEAAEDDDDEMDAKSKAARLRERARCSAIFSSPAAGTRPDMAAHLAFATNMSRKDAIASLAIAAQGYVNHTTAAAPPRRSLADRMDRVPNPDLAGDGEAQPLKPHQRLAAAHAKATGQKT